MAYCGECTLATTEGRDKIAVTLRCRAWSCAECAEQRKTQLIALAMDGLPDKLVTLTSRRRPGLKPELAAAALVRAWRLIRRSLERQGNRERVHFLAIFEQTALGWPHLHILVRGPFIPQKWLSAQMDRLADSPIVDVRSIKSRKGAAKYVSKYIAKAPGKFGTLKRYWHSQAFKLSVYVSKKGTALWDRQKLSLTAWCEAWREFGYTVTLESNYRARAQPPPI